MDTKLEHGFSKAKNVLKAASVGIMRALMKGVKSKDTLLLAKAAKAQNLTGIEIMLVRKKNRTIPTRRRVRMWIRKQNEPAHVGKKQQARLVRS